MDREIFTLGVSLCVFSIALAVLVFKHYRMIVNKAQSVADLKIARAQSHADMKATISEKCSQKLLENAEKKQNRILKQARRSADIIIKKSKSRALQVIELAKREKAKVIEETMREQQELIASSQSLVDCNEARIDQLKFADQELQARLKKSKAIIEKITNKSCSHMADITVLNTGGIISGSSYDDEVFFINSSLKALAVNAINGVREDENDKDIVKLVSISTKADIAGALLLTTVEMLCSKTTAFNGPQSLEILSGSILATEALVKCIDSRATINEEFKALLIKRLDTEISFKQSAQLNSDHQLGFREQLLEEQESEEAV